MAARRAPAVQLQRARRAAAPVLSALAVVVAWPALLRAPAWLGGAAGRQEVERRSGLLGGLVALALEPAPVLAEESPALTPRTFSSTSGLVQSPNRDFVIRTPLDWTTSVNNYAGRLVFSTESPTADGNFVFLQVSRLSLPALFKSAGAVLPDAYSACGKWEEVAAGGTSVETLAKWMMAAQQKSMQVAMGRTFDRDVQILDAAPAGAALTWHADGSVPAAASGASALEGSGGKLYTLEGLAGEARLPPRRLVGKALLSKGIAVFAVMDAPQSRLEASYDGTPGVQYFDEVVRSLELIVPQGV